MADEILGYNISEEQLAHVVVIETDQAFVREKGLFDCTYLLKECRRTNASHVATFEEDFLAVDGWYRRTLSAIQRAQNLRKGPDFLYLRLFYIEEILGWNSEHWLTYLSGSAAVAVASGLLLLWIRSCLPGSKRFLTFETVLGICILPVPLLILPIFAASKVSVLPLRDGVDIMNNFGCCSQALVFPQNKLESLIDWYEQALVGFVDMLTEAYADKNNEVRLAVTPM